MENAVEQLLEAWRINNLLTLKQCGHNLDQATRYAFWNWDKI